MTAYAMLGERRSAQTDGFAADSQDRFTARLELADGAGDDVRMQVAIRDVAPCGRVEPAVFELGGAEGQQLLQPIERDDDVGGRLRDPGIERPLSACDSRVHRRRGGPPR